MRVSLKSTTGIVSFGQQPAKILTDVGEFLYRISLSVNVSKAIRNNASIVELAVFVDDPDTLRVVQPTGDPVAVTQAILHLASDQKSAAIVRKNKQVVSSKIDITTKIDNSRIAAIKAGRDSDVQKQLESSSVQVSSVVQTGTSQAARIYSGIRALQLGIDPSSANQIMTTTISAQKTLGGFSMDVARQSDAVVSALQDLAFSPTSAIGEKQSFQLKTNTLFSGDVSIPTSTLEGLQFFYVTARLVSNMGRTVSEAKARIDHTGALAAFHTPTHPPVVTLTTVHDGGLLNFEIKQVDPNATGVSIYRRLVSHVDLAAVRSGYAKVADIGAVTKDGPVKFSDTAPGSKIAIYRFVAFGPGMIPASDFSSIVYRPVTKLIRTLNRRSVFRNITVTAQNIDTGIALEMSSLPHSARSIGALRRDLTLRERDFEFLDIATPVIRIDDPTATVAFSDTSTKPGHIYEYGCRMYARDGSEYLCIGTALIRRIAPSGTGIQLSLSNVTVNKTLASPDVKFDLKSSTTQDSLDQTLQALKKAGLSSVYDDEIKAGKSKLSDLITHGVTRIDTVTGDIDDFGTIVGDSFSDVSSRNSSITADIVPGRKYRYVVSTQLRSADSLLRERTVEKTDDFGRQYSYSPRKYLNPITLRTGTLLPSNGSMVNHPEDEFKLGAVGNEAFIEVTLPGAVTSLTKVSALKKQGRSFIKWSLSGDASVCDHFEVFSVVGDTMKSVGRMQATGASAYEFAAPEGSDEVSKFVIVPVMSDFTQGTYVTVDAV